MIVRLWTTRVDKTRIAEYEENERKRSMPIFNGFRPMRIPSSFALRIPARTRSRIKSDSSFAIEPISVRKSRPRNAAQVPSFNADRSQSLASLDRFKGIATNLHATVVIQHEPRDINKLPIFTTSAQ
jgi:hypothetical protein